MSLSRSLQLPGLLALVLWALVGCDGSDSSSGSSPALPTDPTLSQQNLLVYRSTTRDVSHSQLYRLNRSGESALLSEHTGQASVVDYLVSPDAKKVAYRYGLDGGQTGLAIVHLDTGELVFDTTVTDEMTGVPIQSWEWLPDSSRLVYALLDQQYRPVTLWLASPGDAQSTQLIELEEGVRGQLKYTVSTDGSYIAVAREQLSPDGSYSKPPLSASLYLLDLQALDGPQLVDTATGDANMFRLQWSAFANDLVHQRRLQTDIAIEIGTLNHPAGPLLLLGEDGASTPLHGDYKVDWISPLLWISPTRVVVAQGERFDLVSTDGRLLASHSSTGDIEPSPDGRYLAFLDWSAPDVAEVYLLDTDTNELRVIGPGHSFPGPRGSTRNSDLRWSPDGSWLAWDRITKDTPGEQSDGMYAHSIATGDTQRLETAALENQVLFEQWLLEDNLLNYLFRNETGQTQVVIDLDTDRVLFTGPDCMLGLWLKSGDILGNLCGPDLYVYRLDKHGSVRDRKLIARDAWRTSLSKNQQTVVIEIVGEEYPAGEDYISPNWQLYDFITRTLAPLQGTAGTYCCGTGLQ